MLSFVSLRHQELQQEYLKYAIRILRIRGFSYAQQTLYHPEPLFESDRNFFRTSNADKAKLLFQYFASMHTPGNGIIPHFTSRFPKIIKKIFLNDLFEISFASLLYAKNFNLISVSELEKVNARKNVTAADSYRSDLF